MAKSLMILHDQNVIHNDIKDDNFFLFDYDFNLHKFDIKLGDFGYSEILNQNSEKI